MHILERYEGDLKRPPPIFIVVVPLLCDGCVKDNIASDDIGDDVGVDVAAT